MNKYLKSFLLRGFFFSGLGPIVFGIVIMCIGFCEPINLAGWQILLGIVSTYLIAFVQAGSSVFEQIEEWSTPKSACIHLLSIYLVYLAAYLVNSWIPLNWIIILIFSAIVIVTFLVIWLICFFTTNKTKKQLNSKLK